MERESGGVLYSEEPMAVSNGNFRWWFQTGISARHRLDEVVMFSFTFFTNNHHEPKFVTKKKPTESDRSHKIETRIVDSTRSSLHPGHGIKFRSSEVYIDHLFVVRCKNPLWWTKGGINFTGERRDKRGETEFRVCFSARKKRKS